MENEQFYKYALEKGFVKCKIVVFTLPSEYRGSSAKVVKGEDGFEEVRKLVADPNVFRSLRARFYTVLRKIAWRSELGWVLRSGCDPSLLDPLIDEVRSLLRKYNLSGSVDAVEIVEVLVPRHYLVKELRKYIREKKLDLQKLKEKYEERKKAGKAVWRIKNELLNLESEIKSLIKELEKLESLSI